MAKNVFKFGSGKSNTFAPSEHYAGSERGGKILEALELTVCVCGQTNVFDSRPTNVRQLCTQCGRDIG